MPDAPPPARSNLRSIFWNGWSLAIFSLLIGLSILANREFEYMSHVTKVHLGESVVDEQELSRERARYMMAGWPYVFRVKTIYQAGAPFEVYDRRALAINCAIFLGVGLLAWLYVGMWRARFRSKGISTTSKVVQVSVANLFCLMIAVAGVMAHWNTVQARSRRESKLVADIRAVGGDVRHEAMLPLFLKGSIPNWLISPFARITAVNLTAPTSELVHKVTAIPMLTELRIAGGDYDLRALDPIRRLPMLVALRISGRKLDDTVAGIIGSMKQLQSLNLMRTNVTATWLDSLGEMPRLRNLNLVHTDVHFDKVPSTPPWGKMIRELSLPHPPPDAEDSITIRDWPELELVTCTEFDEMGNMRPVHLAISFCPKLAKLKLDVLQVFDVDLEELPSMTTMEPLFHQWMLRCEGECPDDLWLQRIRVRNVPMLTKLALFCGVLQEIDLEASQVKHIALRAERRFPATDGRFQSVRFNDNAVRRDTRQHWLACLGKMRRVESIQLGGVPLKEVDLSPLSACRTLHHLELEGSGVTQSQLEVLASMTELDELGLGGLALDASFVQQLLKSHPTLVKLRCNSASIPRLRIENMPNLVDLIEETSQIYHDFEAVRFVDVPKLAEWLDLSPRLMYLHLDNVQSLRSLTLRGRIPKKGVIRGLRDLAYFAAGGPEVNDALMQEILKCENLEKLTLAYADVSPELLEKIGTFRNLRVLALPGCKVTDNVLAAWKNLTQLEALIVDDTSVTNAGLSQLNLPQLTRLSINNTQADGSILPSLIAPNGLTKIYGLGIGGIAMTPAQLAFVNRFEQLSWLDLSGSKLNLSLVEPMLQVPAPKLQLLFLRNATVDTRTLLSLIRKRPSAIDITDTLCAPEVLQAIGPRNIERSEFDSLKYNTLAPHVPAGYENYFPNHGSRSRMGIARGEIHNERIHPTAGSLASEEPDASAEPNRTRTPPTKPSAADDENDEPNAPQDDPSEESPE